MNLSDALGWAGIAVLAGGLSAVLLLALSYESGKSQFYPVVYAIAVLVVGACLLGKSRELRPVVTVRIDNIERVFMHMPSEYSVMVRNQNSGEMTVGYIRHLVSVKFFDDVVTNKPMWAILTCKKNSGEFQDCIMEVHIRSVKLVEGGKWKRYEGKFVRKGFTNVIQ